MVDRPENPKHRIFKNGVYSVLSWILPLVMGLVVTPYIVRRLGNEAYGLYSVILGFISYSFSIGIGKTAAKYVAEYRAAGEVEKLNETLSSIFWISLAFGLGSLAILFLTANYIVADVLLIAPESRQTATTALYVAGLTILVTMISQIFQFVLQGLQRFDRFLFLTNLHGALLNLGSLAIVLNGRGVLELIIWNLVVVLSVGTLYLWNAGRLLSGFRLRYKIKNEVWRPSVKYALSIVVYQSFGNIMLLFERGWILRKFGAEAVTFYVVPMSLGFYFHGLVSSIIIVMFPVVNQYLDSRETLLRIYKTTSKIVLTMAAFFVVTCIFEGGVFLDTWMKADFASHSYSILVIHAFTFTIISITGVSWQLIESFGRARLNAAATVVWMLIAVPLMVVFSYQWQGPGVAFARLVGVFALIPAIFYVEKELLGGILARFWIATPSKLILAGLVCGGVQWLIIYSMDGGWMALVAAGSAGLAAFAGVLLTSGFFEESEKAALREIMWKFRGA